MQYLTPKQVSDMTRLKYSTVLSWANKGILPARRIHNGKKSKYLFVEKEVVQKIESCRLSVL